MRRVLRTGLLAVVVALPVALGVGWLVDGTSGLVGALLGVLLPVTFFAMTVATAVVTGRQSPGAMGATVLVSWVVKLVLLVVALALLDQADGWSRPVFAGAFALAVPAWLGMEAWLVVRTRQPYTGPVPSRRGVDPRGGDASEVDGDVGRVRSQP